MCVEDTERTGGQATELYTPSKRSEDGHIPGGAVTSTPPCSYARSVIPPVTEAADVGLQGQGRTPCFRPTYVSSCLTCETHPGGHMGSACEQGPHGGSKKPTVFKFARLKRTGAQLILFRKPDSCQSNMCSTIQQNGHNPLHTMHSGRKVIVTGARCLRTTSCPNIMT